MLGKEDLKLNYLCPTASTEEGEELPREKVGVVMRIKAVSVGYVAGKLRPRTQWLEFTNYTNRYSPLRFTNSTRQKQATTQT